MHAYTQLDSTRMDRQESLDARVGVIGSSCRFVSRGRAGRLLDGRAQRKSVRIPKKLSWQRTTTYSPLYIDILSVSCIKERQLCLSCGFRTFRDR